MPTVETMVLETPVEPAVAAELTVFWESVFGTSYAESRLVLMGAEKEHNRNILFIAHEAGHVAATCQLTIPCTAPELGGLGEVAVLNECRGRGFAHVLCGRARDHFQQLGGRALFLATSNPAAARVYQDLGWRFLGQMNVMVNVAGTESPTAFLESYFHETAAAVIREGAAADRIPVIPALVTPQDGHVLDANLGFFSTRYVPQKICMGLYPAYARLRGTGGGTWFSAWDQRRRVIGLASVRRDASDAVQVDGFTLPGHGHCWKELVQAVTEWGRGRGAAGIRAIVCVMDVTKQTRFEECGFRIRAENRHIDFPDGPVMAVEMEKS